MSRKLNGILIVHNIEKEQKFFTYDETNIESLLLKCPASSVQNPTYYILKS